MFDFMIAKGSKQEYLGTFIDYKRNRITLPLFGIASEFVRVFSHLPRQGRKAEDVYKALAEVTANFYRAFNGQVIFETPCIPSFVQMAKEEMSEDREWFHDWFWFSLEVMALEAAVNAWLTPRRQNKGYVKPAQQFIRSFRDDVVVARQDLEALGACYLVATGLAEGTKEQREFTAVFLEEYARWALYKRSLEVSAILTLGGDVNIDKLDAICRENNPRVSSSDLLGYWYEGPGLLHLAWIEVAWALMNDQYAHKCDVCGGVFALDRPYTRPAYICSKECAKAWRVQKAGGLDALRAYNREAQRRHRAKERQKVK